MRGADGVADSLPKGVRGGTLAAFPQDGAQFEFVVDLLRAGGATTHVFFQAGAFLFIEFAVYERVKFCSEFTA